MDEWKLADAKNRLSEVIEKACAEGPQTITRNGRKVAVVVPYEQFERDRDLEKKSENQRFIEHLFAMPLAPDGEEDDLFERLPVKPREVEF